jgi:hypothetical protein
MHSTATDRAWDALALALDTLSSATLARIARGEELMPKHSGIRVLVARNRLDVADLCRHALALRGEDDAGQFVGWEGAASAYMRDAHGQQQHGAGASCRHAPHSH